MSSQTISGFLPSSSAFRFPNTFPEVPVRTIPIPNFGEIPIGDASGGLCGGMAYATRDYFEFGLPIPPDTDPPEPDSQLFRFLVDRLVDSFDLPWGVARYFELMQMPDHDHLFVRGAARRSVEDEWPRVRQDIDAGRLSPLGLVTVRSLNPMDLKHNHQVLAYGYDMDEGAGAAEIRLYDPNRENDDAARLVLTLGTETELPSLSYPGGPLVRAFFRSAYTPVDPR
jgi:hypothetical protein